MSSHNSDNEDAASDRSGSPEQNESTELRLPDNPSNIPKDATISDSRTAQRPKKKPKMAGRTPAKAPEAEYAELQSQPNIDSRPDGGFINPDNARPRDRRMRWDAAADRELLIFGFGREINSKEYLIIANRYDQKPTFKAIQERITKLRLATRRVLKETGIFDPDAVVRPPTGGAPPRGPATPVHGTSSPVSASVKKAAPAKKTRPASGGHKSQPDAFPPGAGSPAPRYQPQPESSGRPQSFQPPQMGLPSAQPPSAHHPPPPAAWDPRFQPGPGVATMYPPSAGSSQASSSQMGMPPMGRPSFPPYSAIPPIVFAARPGMGMGGYPHEQQQQLPLFAPEAFTPTLPSQQPAGTAPGAPIPNMGGAAGGEQEDPMARSERELKEKKAKREARKKSFQPPK